MQTTFQNFKYGFGERASMTIRFVLFVTFSAVCVVFLLFSFYRVFSLGIPQKSPSRLSYNAIRGSSLLYKEKLYTLNFKQQNTLISVLNQSHPTERKKKESYTPCSIEKIVLYRFEELPDLTIEPIGFLKDELVFRVLEWNETQDFKENTEGAFRAFLSKIYDH